MLESIEKVMEHFLMPVAAWVGRNRYIGAIRDAFITFTPFIIAASLFLIVTSFPIPAYQDFMAGFIGENWSTYLEYSFAATFPFMGMFISFLVAYKLARSYEIEGISAGLLSVICFLTITPQASVDTFGGVLPMEWLGSKGLLVGMVIAIISTEVLRLFLRKNWVIKLPEGVPPAVSASFAAIIPALVMMIVMLLVRNGFAMTSFGTFHQLIYQVLATPIRSFGTSLVGAILTVVAISLLWSVGINSGSLVNGILRPFWLENQEINMAAIKLGQTPPNIVTEQFYDMIWMGGAGVTLALVIVILIVAKGKQNRMIGALSVAPGIFNINEPVLFGVPVILNPIMLIPFNVVPIVMVVTQYAAMAIGLVARPTGVVIPWTTPPVISGFIITGHWSGAVMQIVNLIIAGLIYLPFILFIDRQQVKQENELAAAEK
ncbi:PTS sugar transporter subunit IIC [Culicoidibacter larvae]|uniref:Permease IIC component n=1 Tax=Culicoidibacter larvae TaxID=2579976 RepID=A0A5R8QH46_9FIRM|nr:PTS sugar transporter subunit IIC [Culicoidibacter larvae]TLG77318.1 PTS sugar transporter subunit IIC [Culicoidibacter larvae]